MPFTEAQANARLETDETALTEEEIRDSVPWMSGLTRQARARLEAELSLIPLAALKRQEHLANKLLVSFDQFDKATASANRWMLRFTAAVTVLTLLLFLIEVLHSVRTP